QGYALWDVIENGNSFNLVPRITANADGTSTSTISGRVTTEEKEQKKNDYLLALILSKANCHLNSFPPDHPHGFALDLHAPIEIHLVDLPEKNTIASLSINFISTARRGKKGHVWRS
nr:hypothetical protein [Tanacetum cinerariifolium]